MRKVICLLMVLVCCMSLACTAFATQSPGGSAPDVPKTGDNSAIFMWVLVMLVSLVALVAVSMYYRKVAKR